jgi:ABC-2 type transport system ATP-binding protein
MCRAGSGRHACRMNVIEVTHLVKRYGDRAVVDDVSFGVEQGEIFAILGPNGAGKTTTVESISGLRTPDGGSISVLGLDPRRDRDQLREVLGVQLQESELPAKLKVREALDLFAAFYVNPVDKDELLDGLGLVEKRDTQYRKLSGGQKQRLSVALALVGNPRVAILDELTTGLDPQARRDTWQLIEDVRNRGVTVVLVTHFMEEAERLADRIAIIDRGRLIALDTPAGIIARVSDEQRLRFRPSTPLDDSVLTALPEVRSVDHSGPVVIVSGTGNLLGAVSSVLARHEIVPFDLRMEQAGLDDAFVALTGRPLDSDSTTDKGKGAAA